MAVATQTLATGIMAQREFLREKEAAELTGLSLSWLRRQRWLKKPPAFIKAGGVVLYSRSELANWLHSQTIRPEVQ